MDGPPILVHLVLVALKAVYEGARSLRSRLGAPKGRTSTELPWLDEFGREAPRPGSVEAWLKRLEDRHRKTG